MSNKLLTLQEAAKYLRKSETTVYRLVSSGKLRCYGGHNQPKFFSPEKHLDPYLESIETKEFLQPAQEKKPERGSSKRRRSYQYKTSLFADL